MTDTPDSFRLPTGEVQPSQLYVNSEKLAAVVERFDFDEPDYDALPAGEIDGEWVLTDGHTRALCAALAGCDELRVYEDSDDLAMALYAECVRWCKEDGVTGIENLVGRVVGPDRFERSWIERCQRAADRLGEQ